MGTKTNPGKFDCYEAAAPDEPMFVLLARDPLAPYLVRLWALLKYGPTKFQTSREEKCAEANWCANEMEHWRVQTGGGE